MAGFSGTSGFGKRAGRFRKSFSCRLLKLLTGWADLDLT